MTINSFHKYIHHLMTYHPLFFKSWSLSHLSICIVDPDVLDLPRSLCRQAQCKEHCKSLQKNPANLWSSARPDAWKRTERDRWETLLTVPPCCIKYNQRKIITSVHWNAWTLYYFNIILFIITYYLLLCCIQFGTLLLELGLSSLITTSCIQFTPY